MMQSVVPLATVKSLSTTHRKQSKETLIEILNETLTCLLLLGVRITLMCQVQAVHQEFDLINWCWHITRQLDNA